MGDLLGGIAGAAMGAIAPEMGILNVVAKGLELAEGLLGKGDTKDVSKILDMLTQLVGKPGGGPEGAGNAAEPQPFRSPSDMGHPPEESQAAGTGNGGGGSASASAADSARGVNVTVTIDEGRGKASPVSHDRLPEVDGSPQGDQNLSNLASPFVSGSDANKARALKPGSQEWQTVMWAMQKNPNLCYDADSKRFFEKMDNGSKRDLGSLEDAQKVINDNGGWDRNHPVAGGALGDYFDKQVKQADEHPEASSLIEKFAETAAKAGMNPDDANQKIAQMKQKLMDAEDLNQNNIDIDININESMPVRA